MSSLLGDVRRTFRLVLWEMSIPWNYSRKDIRKFERAACRLKYDVHLRIRRLSVDILSSIFFLLLHTILLIRKRKLSSAGTLSKGNWKLVYLRTVSYGYWSTRTFTFRSLVNSHLNFSHLNLPLSTRTSNRLGVTKCMHRTAPYRTR